MVDSIFFKYSIQDTSDLENLLLLLNVSQRQNLQIYIHKNSYPSQDFSEHEYAVGDIPEHVLRAIFRNYYMREMYHDATPFHFVQALDRIVYYDHFGNTNADLFDPDNREKLDTVRI